MLNWMQIVNFFFGTSTLPGTFILIEPIVPLITPESLKLDLCKQALSGFVILTHFSPVSHFDTPCKRQKTKGFLTFSGGI